MDEGFIDRILLHLRRELSERGDHPPGNVAVIQSQTFIRNDQPYAFESMFFQVMQEVAPGFLVFQATFSNTRDFTVSLVVESGRSPRFSHSEAYSARLDGLTTESVRQDAFESLFYRF